MQCDGTEGGAAVGRPLRTVVANNDSDVQLSSNVQNAASMQYRNTDTSFESEDRSGVQCDDFDGEMIDWDYENVHWNTEDSQSSAEDSALEQVTLGVRRQSLVGTPVQDAAGGRDDMNVDFARDSAELIDLTNTPSLAARSTAKSSDDEVIDLC